MELGAGAMTAGCVVPYIRGIRRGETKPQRTSWLVFSVMSTVAAFAQLAQGATAGALLSAGGAMGFSAVFVLSIRHGVGGTERSDALAVALLAVGCFGWWATSNPLVAVGAVIVGEVPAVILTAAKSRRDPGTEVLGTWAVDGAAGAVAAASVGGWVAADLLYPVYHCLANAVVVGAILLGRRATPHRTSLGGL